MAELHLVPVRSSPSDEDARVAALDIRASCIVEAPAGSGKTGLLVQRLLKLLADPEVQSPEEVLAITFTRKATAEMRHRVLEELHAAQANLALPPSASPFEHSSRALALAALAHSRQAGWELLDHPQRLHIKTFDAVTAEIAGSLPLLSGSGGPRRPLEDASALHRLAARNTLLQLGGTDAILHAALRDLLLHRDASVTDCEALLAAMLQTREQWGELIPLDRRVLDDAFLDTEVRPQLERALEQIICSALTRVLHAFPPNWLRELTTLGASLGHAPGYQDQPSPIALCAGLHEPPQAAAAHLEHWLALLHLLLKKDGGWRTSSQAVAPRSLLLDLERHHRAELRELVSSLLASLGEEEAPLREALLALRRLPPPRYPDDQWAVCKSLFRVLRHALVELQLLFAARGECDFAEFSLAARHALRSAEPGLTDAALTAGGRLRHLLIDEMQDTSAAQYDLLHLLTQSWDGRSQTLFLVGDPKQSIYLFRQARVERFLRTVRERRLGEIPLLPLQLTANFRSQPALIREFNRTFSLLFPAPGAPTVTGLAAVDVPFVAATLPGTTPVPDPPADGPSLQWHAVVLGEEPAPDPTGSPVCDHRLQEARTLCSLVQQLLAAPLPPERAGEPWRIAILTRARNHISEIVTELKRLGIPFRAVDLDPLTERPEVLDALALTRALLHPADRTAWLAVLHAPWVGLGLADLLTLTGDALPSSDPDADATIFTLLPQRAAQLSPTGQELLARAWPVLAAAVSSSGTTPLSVHVERTWRSLGGDTFLSAEPLANVLRFFSLLRDFDASAPDLDRLHDRLDKLYAEPLPSTVQVEVLTIHKAKGLEWDMVLVPGLERQGGKDGSVLLNWLEFDEPDASDDESLARILLAPIAGKGRQSSELTKWLRSVRSARDRAERKRLFYVAVTRARRQVHLFAARERKNSSDGFAAPRYGSLLEAVLPAAEQAFEPLRTRPAAEDQTPAQQAPQPSTAQVLAFPDPAQPSDDLTLAAGAAADPAAAAMPAPSPPLLQRLPLDFQPAQRFARAAARSLAYPAAASPDRLPFDRPEGSFAARAFGNVVHRYLQLLAERLLTASSDALLAELPQWLPRLTVSLRGEGLAPAPAAREALRAQRALTLTLQDPTGLWLLSPHPGAASEAELTSPTQTLRVDRTFLAGAAPLSTAQPGDLDTCLWIVDFKTSEPGARHWETFAAAQTDAYRPQLEAYARLRRTLPGGERPIRLGLYYPLIPRLLFFPSQDDPL